MHAPVLQAVFHQSRPRVSEQRRDSGRSQGTMAHLHRPLTHLPFEHLDSSRMSQIYAQMCIHAEQQMK